MKSDDARAAALAIGKYLIDNGHGISINDSREFQSIILAAQSEPPVSLEKAVEEATTDINLRFAPKYQQDKTWQIIKDVILSHIESVVEK